MEHLDPVSSTGITGCRKCTPSSRKRRRRSSVSSRPVCTKCGCSFMYSCSCAKAARVVADACDRISSVEMRFRMSLGWISTLLHMIKVRTACSM
eukprot:Skav200814  [mRNA]  locus=scaffold1819:148644:155562:- [translate_table: standard]